MEEFKAWARSAEESRMHCGAKSVNLVWIKARSVHTMHRMSTLASPAASSPARPLSGLLLACLAATWLVWGSTYLAIKYALVSFPPFFQMGTRFLFAGVVLMAWMRGRGSAWPDARQW